MRVTTHVEIDIESGEILDWGGYEYFGPIAECKKGREQTTAGANAAEGTAALDTTAQTNARVEAKPFADSLLATKPGALSPLAQAQYAGDVRNIHDTYGQLTQSGLKGIGYQGWNNAPSGMEASLKNSAIRNEGAAETGAYENAQQQTNQQGLAGIGYQQGQQQIYNPVPAESTTIAGGQARSQEGSTAGDILGGIGTLSQAFKNVVPGGIKV